MKYKDTAWRPAEEPIESHRSKSELGGWDIFNMWPVAAGVFIIVWQKKDTPKKVRADAFIPPQLSEVQAFIDEKKVNVNARDFIDFYAKRDWKNSNDKPVRNWKSTLLNNWVHDSVVPSKEDLTKPKV